MGLTRLPWFLFVIVCCFLVHAADGKESSPPEPLGWIYIADNSHDLFTRPGRLKGAGTKLTQGMLAPVSGTTEKAGDRWVKVRFLDLATGSARVGWVEEGREELLPSNAYPGDSALLAQVGAPFVDDLAARHTLIARFLIHHGADSPLLLCYFYSPLLPVARLVAFRRDEKRFLPGASLEFPVSELHAGPVFLEVRNLLNDGSDCFVTHEPFREGPQTGGTNLIIRRIGAEGFRTLWQAPLEYRNLSEFRSNVQILQPQEKNIGAPGTVTKGDTTFRANGAVKEPVWKGKIEFFLFGREKPVDSAEFERVCPWNGREFAPLH